MMSQKKPYDSPQLFRVELNHNQAILSDCSLTAPDATNGMMIYCRIGGCKSHHNGNMADNAARPS